MSTIIRKAKREEVSEVVDLVNQVFRLDNNFDPTMGQEFPLLLTEDNHNHMVVATKDNRIISTVNYMVDNMSINGTRITHSAVGAVCTDSNDRGKRLSSTILKNVQEHMESEGISICTISGDRNLYTRWNACKVNSFYKYFVQVDKKSFDFELIDIKENDIDYLVNRYINENIRYIRTKTDFIKLLKGATVPWGTFRYEKKLIKKDGKVLGYVVLRTFTNKDFGEVVEMKCNQTIASDVLQLLAYSKQLSGIYYYVGIKDYKNHLPYYHEKKIDPQHGTVKIISFMSLMKELRPYIAQLLTDEELSDFSYGICNGYYFKYKDEILMVESLVHLTKIIFDFYALDSNHYDANNPLIKLLKKIFPVQLPYTRNLNYQ